MAWLVWLRKSSVVSLVSKNLFCRAICPVTVAPASAVAASVIPATTEARRAGLSYDQQPLAREQVVQHHGLDRLRVSLVHRGLRLGRVALAAHLAQFGLQLGGGAVQQVVCGSLQLGGAEHDPDGQREEYRHDGYQVVAKINH